MSGITNSAGSRSGIIGYHQNPEVPAFLASILYARDSTHGTIPFDFITYNVGSHFNVGTYTFTAPVNGLYSFTLNIGFNGIIDSSLYFGFNFVVGGVSQTWQWIWENSKAHDYWTNCTTRQFQMDAGDTCLINLSGSGTGQFNIRYGTTNSTFSGYLIG
jgi:hypothetical protein